MLRKIVGVCVVLATLWLAKQAFLAWDDFYSRHGGESHVKHRGTAPPVDPQSLPGLPPHLEASLQVAQQRGATAMKNWIRYYRPQMSDPRLAWIELDYVHMVSSQDMAEARTVFAGVKARLDTLRNTPVYDRVKRLGQSYE